MPFNWSNRLTRHLAPYINAQDPVVSTVLGAFATQWASAETLWNTANDIWGILGATGTNLTRIADYFSVARLPNETDAHLLQRMAATLSRTPTQVGVQQALQLLNFTASPVPVYFPLGGTTIAYDPSVSFRFHASGTSGTFTRASSAWDPFSHAVLGENEPTFQSVGPIPNAPTWMQTGVGVWQASTNLWPHSEWTAQTALTPTMIPTVTEPGYWTLVSGTMPVASGTSWTTTDPAILVTGPEYSPPQGLSGTITTAGIGGILFGWGASEGYVAGVSGTTVYLGTAGLNGPVIISSGTLSSTTAVAWDITWDTGGAISAQWSTSTQSGTLSITSTTLTQGVCGWAQWVGSGTFTPGAISSPWPTNLTLTLPQGPAVQLIAGSTAQLPAPGQAASWWDPVGYATTQIQGPSVSTTSSGTWSWWGQSAFTNGTGVYQAGSWTSSWDANTWMLWSLSVPSGTYTPTWIFSGTQGTAQWGMPQWETLGFATPYIPNPAASTTRAAETASLTPLWHAQTQGIVGFGLYVTDALNATPQTVWAYQSGTYGLTVDWDGTAWTSTWTTPSGSVSGTQTFTLAPNQWHYGLWQWGSQGWSAQWDTQILSGTAVIPWASGTYTAALGSNTYWTNLSILDGVLPPATVSLWQATRLTPRYAQTVAQGNFVNAQFATQTGQMADGWAYTLGTTLPTTLTGGSTTFLLNTSALNNATLAGAQSNTVPLAVLNQTIQSLVAAGTWVFPYQHGNLT